MSTLSQQMIDNAIDVLVLPPGDVTVQEPLLVEDRRLWITGYGTTLICPSTVDPVLTFRRTGDPNLSMRCGLSGVYMLGSNTLSTGLVVDGILGFSLRDVHVRAFDVGMVFDGVPQHTSVANSVVQSCATGILIESSNDWCAHRLLVNQNALGMHIRQASSLNVFGMGLQGGADVGVWIEPGDGRLIHGAKFLGVDCEFTGPNATVFKVTEGGGFTGASALSFQASRLSLNDSIAFDLRRVADTRLYAGHLQLGGTVTLIKAWHSEVDVIDSGGLASTLHMHNDLTRSKLRYV